MKIISSIPTFLLVIILALALSEPYLPINLSYPFFGWSLYDTVQDNFLKHRFVWVDVHGSKRDLELERGFHLPKYLNRWLTRSYYTFVRGGESLQEDFPGWRDPKTFVLIEDYKKQLMDHFRRSMNITESGVLKVSTRVIEPLKQVKTGDGIVDEVLLYEWRVP